MEYARDLMEIGSSVIAITSQERGEVISIRESLVPMVEVEWESGRKDWLPPEMVRVDSKLTRSRARQVFDQNDGDTTKAYYEEMNKRGFRGQLAVALFRAQKRSTAAKRYRRGKFRHAAYDVKNWSLSEICRVLGSFDHSLSWGWKIDPLTPGFNQVLYVDLPTGQCSFHSAVRLRGPEYKGEWDGKHQSAERIIAFCDHVLEEHQVQNLEAVDAGNCKSDEATTR